MTVGAVPIRIDAVVPAPPISLHERGATARLHLDDLVVIAGRDNPRRSQLLVNRVLGKHLPAPPAAIRGAADELADAIVARAGTPGAVIGMAETATLLGHLVAVRLGVGQYLHTTRHPSQARVLTVTEAHSHATVHHLDADFIDRMEGPIVVIDDEVTTGATFRSLLAAVDPSGSRRLSLAVLVDGRANPPDGDVALVRYSVSELPRDITSREPVPSTGRPNFATSAVGTRRGCAVRLERVRVDASRGFEPGDLDALEASVHLAVGQIAAARLGDGVLCIGIEEHMLPAFLVAEALVRHGCVTTVQSSTRSPILVGHLTGYPITSVLGVPCATDPEVPAFIYGLDRCAASDIVVVGPSTVCHPLAERVRGVVAGRVHEVSFQ